MNELIYIGVDEIVPNASQPRATFPEKALIELADSIRAHGRRAMEKWQAEFFDHTVSDIMTRTPKTVRPETKITEIQRIMNKYKIHSVLVTDDSRHLLGVVDHYSCMI